MEITRTEVWKPVVFRGRVIHDYEVSDRGRVRNIKTRYFVGSRSGLYMRVNLHHEGEQITALVQCIVAETFLGEPPPDSKIHWRDRDKFNCAVENLFYGPVKKAAGGRTDPS